MTETSVADNRTIPTPEQMLTITIRWHRLVIELIRSDGTTLDPDFIADGLQALREGRITITSATQPAIVFEPCDDWSDLDRVPLAALGLPRALYQKLDRGGIESVGHLLLYSKRGLNFRLPHLDVLRVGYKHFKKLDAALAAHGLAMPETSRALSIREAVEIERRKAAPEFVETRIAELAANGAVTLGDLAEELYPGKDEISFTRLEISLDGERPYLILKWFGVIKVKQID